MKTLLQDNTTGEYLLDDDGARSPISPNEARTLIKESCGTRSSFRFEDGKYRSLEILTMDEYIQRGSKP